MVIYEKDNATFENEEVKECAGENILLSDEDPTIIDKDKAEECVDENKKKKYSLMKTQRRLESTKSKNAWMRKYYSLMKTQRRTIRKKPKYGRMLSTVRLHKVRNGLHAVAKPN